MTSTLVMCRPLPSQRLVFELDPFFSTAKFQVSFVKLHIIFPVLTFLKVKMMQCHRRDRRWRVSSWQYDTNIWHVLPIPWIFWYWTLQKEKYANSLESNPFFFLYSSVLFIFATQRLSPSWILIVELYQLIVIVN